MGKKYKPKTRKLCQKSYRGGYKWPRDTLFSLKLGNLVAISKESLCEINSFYDFLYIKHIYVKLICTYCREFDLKITINFLKKQLK